MQIDEALLKVKKANLDGTPFQLLISDLSFKEDHQLNKLNSGEELIAAVKRNALKIIVFD
jgi:alpha-tubulin suppressor-like RCC1 family protein